MPTWILGYFWSLPKGVSPRPERGHARAISSRVETGMSGNFLSCSKGVKNPLQVP